jgi:hypothetical protein
MPRHSELDFIMASIEQKFLISFVQLVECIAVFILNKKSSISSDPTECKMSEVYFEYGRFWPAPPKVKFCNRSVHESTT